MSSEDLSAEESGVLAALRSGDPGAADRLMSLDEASQQRVVAALAQPDGSELAGPGGGESEDSGVVGPGSGGSAEVQTGPSGRARRMGMLVVVAALIVVAVGGYLLYGRFFDDDVAVVVDGTRAAARDGGSEGSNESAGQPSEVKNVEPAAAGDESPKSDAPAPGSDGEDARATSATAKVAPEPMAEEEPMAEAALAAETAAAVANAEAALADAEAAAAAASAEQQAEAQAALEAAQAEAEAAAMAAEAALATAMAEAEGAADPEVVTELEAQLAAAHAEAVAAAAAEAEAALEESMFEEESMAIHMDTNGDGEITLGVAMAGPRDDGAYYEALVDAAIEISKANGWADPVVIDNVHSTAAFDALENLVAQGVDVVAIGSSELSNAVPGIVAKYPGVFWYCNCGSGYRQTPGLALSRNDSVQIQYVAGYAAGLLLREGGGDLVAMIGCCGISFEVETELAFRLGLRDVDPSYDVIYHPTGNFLGDFDNVDGATEAFNVALEAGMDAVYPYLGSAYRPVVQLANANGIIVMSTGASNVCEQTDLHWDIAVMADGRDFARAIFPGILSGDIKEGDIKVFTVGRDPEVGSKICDPTFEQKRLLDQAHANVFGGHCLEEFAMVQDIAYYGADMQAPERCTGG